MISGRLYGYRMGALSESQYTVVNMQAREDTVGIWGRHASGRLHIRYFYDINHFLSVWKLHASSPCHSLDAYETSYA